LLFCFALQVQAQAPPSSRPRGLDQRLGADPQTPIRSTTTTLLTTTTTMHLAWCLGSSDSQLRLVQLRASTTCASQDTKRAPPVRACRSQAGTTKPDGDKTRRRCCANSQPVLELKGLDIAEVARVCTTPDYYGDYAGIPSLPAHPEGRRSCIRLGTTIACRA